MVDQDEVKLGSSILRICKNMLKPFTKIVEVGNLGLYFVPIVYGVGLIWFSKMKPVFRKIVEESF